MEVCSLFFGDGRHPSGSASSPKRSAVSITKTWPTQLTATPVALTEPAVVGAQAANLRSGPGTAYGVVGQIAPGDRYKIVGKSADSSWWQIEQADGQQAWVLARLVNPEGALDDIQVVENIPSRAISMCAHRMEALNFG